MKNSIFSHGMLHTHGFGKNLIFPKSGVDRRNAKTDFRTIGEDMFRDHIPCVVFPRCEPSSDMCVGPHKKRTNIIKFFGAVYELVRLKNSAHIMCYQ